MLHQLSYEAIHVGSWSVCGFYPPVKGMTKLQQLSNQREFKLTRFQLIETTLKSLRSSREVVVTASDLRDLEVDGSSPGGHAFFVFLDRTPISHGASLHTGGGRRNRSRHTPGRCILQQSDMIADTYEPLARST